MDKTLWRHQRDQEPLMFWTTSSLCSWCWRLTAGTTTCSTRIWTTAIVLKFGKTFKRKTDLCWPSLQRWLRSNGKRQGFSSSRIPSAQSYGQCQRSADWLHYMESMSLSWTPELSVRPLMETLWSSPSRSWPTYLVWMRFCRGGYLNNNVHCAHRLREQPQDNPKSIPRRCAGNFFNIFGTMWLKHILLDFAFINVKPYQFNFQQTTWLSGMTSLSTSTTPWKEQARGLTTSRWTRRWERRSKICFDWMRSAFRWCPWRGLSSTKPLRNSHFLRKTPGKVYFWNL